MIEQPADQDSFLKGIRVLEVANELGEYCSKILAGLGADVIKVEPSGGESTRKIGPFYQDCLHPDRSLHFWHYNFGKRGIVLDLEDVDDQVKFRKLAQGADVILDTRSRGYLANFGLDRTALADVNPGLIHARITPFGDTGPWSDYQGSDLVHLALGGMMMNTGYDALPSGEYDTPPIAPQMWHSYHIAGEIMASQIIAALVYRHSSGKGQTVTVSVHEAVSGNTELDLPAWIFARQPYRRQTCRHAYPQTTQEPRDSLSNGVALTGISRTRDGRWLLANRIFVPGFFTPMESIKAVMEKRGFEHGFQEEKYNDPDYLQRPEVGILVGDVIDRFVSRFDYAHDIWRDGQAMGLAWAPLRRPEENTTEEHWSCRETFLEVEHPDLGRSFIEVGAKWMAPEIPWRKGPRAPLLGEHNTEVLEEWQQRVTRRNVTQSLEKKETSPHGKPFALDGVRIIDLTWLLASGGAGRFFTAHGAEVIKVEFSGRPDGMRFGGTMAPPGGRAERDAAREPMNYTRGESLNRCGNFMDINAGKLSLSLDLKHPRGKELLSQLLKDADMVIEGFSPGTMDRMGLGYERLREINPRIIYVQQSGMGQIGTYGRMRSYGPTAQAFSGLSEMSGLPDPWPPAGIGYSYLDWFGAYQMATAMMAALFRQRQSGKGCWIDSSQVETGLYLTGSAVLDYSANGRHWNRYGNRSPYLRAAPHGAYRCSVEDRWIAIAVFEERQWHLLAKVLGHSEWTSDNRFVTLDYRFDNQDLLDTLINTATEQWDAFELMKALQEAGVPAGVCQTAQDRYESDPQLRHLGWLLELNQTEIGLWPAKEIPVHFSETPVYLGGKLNRHGPCYGEDNDYVLRELLGLGDQEIEELITAGVIHHNQAVSDTP